jgi:hypothetical protein
VRLSRQRLTLWPTPPVDSLIPGVHGPVWLRTGRDERGPEKRGQHVRDKPFPSETGYRSFLGHSGDIPAGMSVDQFCKEMWRPT